MRGFGRARCLVAKVGARQSKENHGSAGHHDRQQKETTLRTRETAGKVGSSDRVRGEEMALDHQAAIRNTVEERLRPVPGHVEADGPPQRTSAPQTEAKQKAGQTRGEQAERRLAGV